MMSIDTLAAGTTFCREITPEEVEHYREVGWVMLRKFISPDMIAKMLAKAQALMGEDGDSNPPYGFDQPYFNAQAAAGFADPEIRPSFFGFGQAAKALMSRQNGTGVRLFNDNFVPKLPAGKKTRNQGNGPTSFHQDFITFAVDRTGGLTFWVPFEAYGPEAGTMSSLNRSHGSASSAIIHPTMAATSGTSGLSFVRAKNPSKWSTKLAMSLHTTT